MPEIRAQTHPVLSDATKVEAFFAQVSGLARAARDSSFGMHRVGGTPAALAAILQVLLHEGPQTVPRIGRARSTSRQNTQILVNRMVAEKWVELIENPAHKRSALVQLTEEGRRLAQSAVEREAGLHRLVMSHVSIEDLEKTNVLLTRLREILANKQTVPPERNRPPNTAYDSVRPEPGALESVPGAENYERQVNLA